MIGLAKNFRVLILSLFLIIGSAFGSSRHWYELKRENNWTQVSLVIPKNWRTDKDALGIPLLITSPLKKKGRVTLSVVPLGIPAVELKKKFLKKTQNKYRKGRLRFLARFEGDALEFFPHRKSKWLYSEDVHQIGYRYRIGGIVYVENSYYVNCRGQMYLLKSLYRDSDWGRQAKMIEGVAQSFQCRKSTPKPLRGKK